MPKVLVFLFLLASLLAGAVVSDLLIGLLQLATRTVILEGARVTAYALRVVLGMVFVTLITRSLFLALSRGIVAERELKIASWMAVPMVTVGGVSYYKVLPFNLWMNLDLGFFVLGVNFVGLGLAILSYHSFSTDQKQVAEHDVSQVLSGNP